MQSQTYTLDKLSQTFGISAQAVREILAAARIQAEPGADNAERFGDDAFAALAEAENARLGGAKASLLLGRQGR
jgi:hypothetical protein